METGWEYIHTIHMSVQTAELRLDHMNAQRQLCLSCTLLTIARGSAQLYLSADDNTVLTVRGKLHIDASRPVMNGRITLGTERFEALLDGFSRPAVRPVTLACDLEQPLPVSLEGLLYIDTDQNLAVTGLSSVIPLK